MRYPSTTALFLRSVFVLLTACGLVLGGVFLDILTGASPLGVVSFLFIAITFGVIMIYVIITSSFPRTGGKTGGDNPGA